MMIIRSKAPLRISFAGGGTDVEPYVSEKGGVVLNATINKYAYASLSPREDGTLNVQSLDYDIVAKYSMNDGLPYDGKLDLIKAVIKMMNIDEASRGFDLFIHSDAPPGSGLGSSSTLVVALLGAFRDLLKRQITNYEMADAAFTIEREELGIKGGIQDQYAAAFGGFNFMEFRGRRAVVHQLRVDPEVMNELKYRLLLCYTGTTRLSARIIDTQVQNYVTRAPGVEESLDAMKTLTIEMKNCLLRGEIDRFGNLLDESWKNKKRMASQISNTQIDQLYSLAKANGAVGGKILGAGGGGYLLFLCKYDRKHIIANKLEQYGGKIVDFDFDFGGLQTWCPEHERIELCKLSH